MNTQSDFFDWFIERKKQQISRLKEELKDALFARIRDCQHTERVVKEPEISLCCKCGLMVDSRISWPHPLIGFHHKSKIVQTVSTRRGLESSYEVTPLVYEAICLPRRFSRSFRLKIFDSSPWTEEEIMDNDVLHYRVTEIYENEAQWYDDQYEQ